MKTSKYVRRIKGTDLLQSYNAQLVDAKERTFQFEIPECNQSVR